MKPIVLLLALVLHLGLSNRHGSVVKFKSMTGKEYTLQFCSLATPGQTATTSMDCTKQDSTCQMCNNQTDFFCVSHNKQEMLPPSLTLATNCPATILSTTTITATQASSMNQVYTTCTTTYITTVTVSTTPTPSVGRNQTINLHSQAILGTAVGILCILLVIVSTGWTCTCWAMKKRRQEMNINTTNIRYSEIQVTNGNNIMSLRHNQAYDTQPKKETNNSNTDGEYEVIPPLMNEKTRLNTTEVDDDRENVNVQTSQSTTQQASPGQPTEEMEHTHVQLEQPITESSEQKDLTGNDNVYHTSESKAEDNDDKEAPYEVPVPTLMKTKNQE